MIGIVVALTAGILGMLVMRTSSRRPFEPHEDWYRIQGPVRHAVPVGPGRDWVVA